MEELQSRHCDIAAGWRNKEKSLVIYLRRRNAKKNVGEVATDPTIISKGVRQAQTYHQLV